MTWLFTQLWFLLLVAFVAGAVVAYVVLGQLVPDVGRLETGARKEGEH
jgi:hypothetical protein